LNVVTFKKQISTLYTSQYSGACGARQFNLRTVSHIEKHLSRAATI